MVLNYGGSDPVQCYIYWTSGMLDIQLAYVCKIEDGRFFALGIGTQMGGNYGYINQNNTGIQEYVLDYAGPSAFVAPKVPSAKNVSFTALDGYRVAEFTRDYSTGDSSQKVITYETYMFMSGGPPGSTILEYHEDYIQLPIPITNMTCCNPSTTNPSSAMSSAASETNVPTGVTVSTMENSFFKLGEGLFLSVLAFLVVM